MKPKQSAKAQQDVARLDPDIPWAIRPTALPVIAALVRAQREGTLRPDPEANLLVAAGGEGEDQRVAGKVAILTMRGVIRPRSSFLSYLFGEGSGGLEGFLSDLEEAVANDDIGSVLLEFDSPGGSVELLSEAAAAIREARGTKPLVAIANTMCASAAYWLAAQADELIVTPSGVVGSVGVFSLHEDWSKFNEEFGVDPTYVSAGKFKTEGNMDEPLTDSARAHMQQTVDDYYGQFVSDVATGRGVSEATVRKGYGEGLVLTAQRALDAGMVDRVESMDDLVTRMVAGDTTANGAAVTGASAELLSSAQREKLGLAEDAKPEAVLAALDAALGVAPKEPGDGDDSGGDPDDELSPETAVPPFLLIPTPRH